MLPLVPFDGDGRAAACAELGLGCEGAEFGVEGDVVDGGLGGGVGFALVAGEVEAGDLEAVEEKAGAARVEFIGGDALEDLGDGGLDGGAVFDERQVEGGSLVFGLARRGSA